MIKMFKLALIVAVGFLSFFYQMPNAKADESTATSTVNKAKDTAGDAATDAKVGVRNGKQKIRKVIGTDTVTKDVKDSVNNAKDKTGNAVNKVERKAESN